MTSTPSIGVIVNEGKRLGSGLEELRAAVRSLVTPDQASRPVAEMLAAIVKAYSQATEAAVALSVQPSLPEPDADGKLVIIRTAQEALTNAQKHACATRVELSLTAAGGNYLLICRDNGRGIGPETVGDPTRRHFGIENLRTRAATIGGSIELRSQSGGGALLRLVLPVSRGTKRG